MATNIMAGMIRFQKKTFDRAFSVVDMVQDLSEIWFAMILQRSDRVPAEGMRFADEWIRMSKKGRKAFKVTVNEFYKSVLNMFPDAEAGTPSSEWGNGPLQRILTRRRQS